MVLGYHVHLHGTDNLYVPFEVLTPQQICAKEGKEVESKQRADTKNPAEHLAGE